MGHGRSELSRCFYCNWGQATRTCAGREWKQTILFRLEPEREKRKFSKDVVMGLQCTDTKPPAKRKKQEEYMLCLELQTKKNCVLF